MRLSFVVLFAGVAWQAVAACAADPDAARELLQRGSYDEAIAAFEALAGSEQADDAARTRAVLGLSRACQQRGLWEAASRSVAQRLEEAPEDAALLARQSELSFLRGNYEAAARSAARALEIDDDQLLARLVTADLAAETGKLDAALDGYRWFVRYYNSRQPTDAQSLMLVARGSLQYARWKSVSPIFHFVVNTLAVDARADDPLCWQASLLAGEVFLEKYNQAQATSEFEAALAVNPRAAEVVVAQGRAALHEHDIAGAVAFAQQALQINPALPSALLLAADASLAAGDLAAAMDFVDAARKINPLDQRILARQAAVVVLDDGVPERETLTAILEGAGAGGLSDEAGPSRFAATCRSVFSRNPRPGVFLSEVGEILDAHRKYAAAEVCFRRAVDLMPQLSSPRTSLGMLAMRTGNLEEAQSILDAAFKADPYHVRVSNLRKVLGQLREYDTLTTDHFVIRTPKSERLLAEAMAAHLEETYAELTQLFGFEPQTRTQFEVYGAAGGNSGHQWFSARMVGLPWIQTVGASTGMIVAMASPNDAREPFNWARVVRHEFVHILTLQQTRFNIPHWYTEALAVRTEGVTPPEWDPLLLRRVPAGDVFTLADINSGFQRPDEPEDWQMAYCQSWLYAGYITDRFGEDAHARLLDAYRRNLSTDAAIPDACGVDVADFEAGYSGYVGDYVAGLRGSRVDPPPSVESAQAKWREHPTDGAAQAELAWALWNADHQREARDIAGKLLETSPAEPLAVAVVAAARVREGDFAAAEALLKLHFDPEHPRPELLAPLAKAYSARHDWPRARALWQEGVARWPREPEFLKGLAACLLRQGDEAALRPILDRLAALDGDDLLSRQKLASLANADEEWEPAIRWAREALQIDVTDESMHRVLAAAYAATGDASRAEQERRILDRLSQ